MPNTCLGENQETNINIFISRNGRARQGKTAIVRIKHTIPNSHVSTAGLKIINFLMHNLK